ncbi:MAG TPA: two-component system response regulator [Lentisphaeria bacterium]|nr:MAG: hypothetical protein A2X47_09950 [Lentisphaerae bacterium GWF2_38_69]HBM17333.1 two-component system response regulator [Lentisphaeria bacterium]
MSGIKHKAYLSSSILIIDDDPDFLDMLKSLLFSSGYENVISCDDPRQVMDILKKNNIELVLLDLNMPYIQGNEILNQILSLYPLIPVIIISGSNDISSAVKCIKEGAFDYITKPIEKDRLLSIITTAIKNLELKEENLELKKKLFSDFSDINKAFSGIITNSHLMKSIFKYCEAISCSKQPVLITGETGTGKELIAKALFKLYNVQGKFVSVNIAGLDDNMFSDSLFGHVKGSYTGASTSREGLVNNAENGVLFLDEIGDLNFQSQVKLLRLLQEREYSPLGSDTTKRSNTRFILATNKEVSELKKSDGFRKDLFYRLSTHQINLPPLRERAGDIPLLLNTFILEASEDMGIKAPSYHPDVVTLLKTYRFQGNVRELQGMVYNAISKNKSNMLSAKSFREYIDTDLQEERELNAQSDSEDKECAEWVSQLNFLPSFKQINNIICNEALKRSNGNQQKASKLLRISPQALGKRIKKRAE